MKRLLMILALVLSAAPGAAQAATVNMRIEGAGRTLFEGGLVVTSHNVQSVSERAIGAIRPCDGTNNGAGGAPAPTGTSAMFDALALQGQGFDGQWYDQYDDYLISKLGGESASWRLFRNGAFAPVGGLPAQAGRRQHGAVVGPVRAGAGPVPLGLDRDHQSRGRGLRGRGRRVPGPGAGHHRRERPAGAPRVAGRRLVPDQGARERQDALQPGALLPLELPGAAAGHDDVRRAGARVLRPRRFRAGRQPRAGHQQGARAAVATAGGRCG